MKSSHPFWRFCNAAVAVSIKLSAVRRGLRRRCSRSCRYSRFCLLYRVESSDCRVGGGYCGQYRKFQQGFLSALSARFGPPLRVEPWGKCIVILDAELAASWPKELARLGFQCHIDTLDGYRAVYIPVEATA